MKRGQRRAFRQDAARRKRTHKPIKQESPMSQFILEAKEALVVMSANLNTAAGVYLQQAGPLSVPRGSRGLLVEFVTIAPGDFVMFSVWYDEDQLEVVVTPDTTVAFTVGRL